MPLSWNDIKVRAVAFERRWRDAVDERAQAQEFWVDFFDIFGIRKPRVAAFEHAVKKPIWDCRMCGQCVLHDTGMTCPMTCPKTLRNGPCGRLREDGRAEVKPEMRC